LAQAHRDWDQEFVQLGRGRYQGKSILLLAGPFQIIGQFGNILTLHRGASPKNLISLAFLSTPHEKALYNGHPWTGKELLVLPPHSNIHFLPTQAKGVITIGFSPDYFQQDRIAGRVYSNLFGHHKAHHLGAHLAPLRRFCLGILSRCANNTNTFPNFTDDPINQAFLSNELLRLMLLMKKNSNEPTCLALPFLALQEVLQHMDQHMAEDLSIEKLAINLKVSERTLRYQFNKIIGESPQTYLRHLRLQKIKKMLRSKETQSVTDAAMLAGFNHLGRLSLYYKGLFGRSPSEALRES
jgi:AraC-like DNA-binding protein